MNYEYLGLTAEKNHSSAHCLHIMANVPADPVSQGAQRPQNYNDYKSLREFCEIEKWAEVQRGLNSILWIMWER